MDDAFDDDEEEDLDNEDEDEPEETNDKEDLDGEEEDSDDESDDAQEDDNEDEEQDDESMDDLQKPEAQAIIETVERLGGVEFKELDRGVTVAVLPAGKTLSSVKKLLDEYNLAPERKKGTAVLNEPESFVQHVNRMKDDSTALFASIDPRKPSVMAVYDYHKIDGSPRFGEHRAVYPFPLSSEWVAWVSRNGFQQKMNQKAFAEFLEDRVTDLCPAHLAGPKTKEYVAQLQCALGEPSQIISLARGLSVRVEQDMVNSVVLGTGETQMQWKEVHKDERGEPLSVPGAFLISIPIFVGGEECVLPVRLRYRVIEQKVFWFYDLAMVDRMFREAIDVELGKISGGVQIPVLIGTPEA